MSIITIFHSNMWKISIIFKMYGISEEEVQLDTDIRGSVYNSIALKKIK